MFRRLLRFIRAYYLFVIAAFVGAVSLILQLLGFSSITHWLLGSVAALEVIPLLWGMWQDFRDGSYGIDILAATAIIASVVLGQYWAAIVIVLMLTGGEALENYAENRAKTELNSLLDRAPKMAHLLHGQKVVDILAAEVEKGAKLIIRSGEVVPVDCVILDGTASFDEASLTGESRPQVKNVGDQLLSGSVNLDGVLTVRALRLASDSQYEQIIKLVRNAAKSSSPFVRLADRFSIPFTAVSFIIAIGAWVLGHHAIRFLEVLVVATPCPLILAAPIAVISGMSRAAKHGIIVKTGSSLERLAEAQTIAFDKTGTLTQGQLSVDQVTTFGRVKKEEVLRMAAALEQGSTHVLAQAVMAAAAKQRLKFPRAKNIKEQPGLGLEAVINAKSVLVGRPELLLEHGVQLPANTKSASVNQTATLVSIDGVLAGTITFKDSIRPESKSTIQRLRDMKVKDILMITGDNKSTARKIGQQLGITGDEIKADMLPSDKLRVIEQITDRPVAFVGDGINDAPVLTASDVGIALGARGESAASESADMVIMLDDLSRVATAVSIAKRTFSIARQSILVGIFLSIILMLIFSTGRFRPIYGAFIQELVDVVVIFNALRAHTDKKKDTTKLVTERN